jgi:ATP-dependent RNA helicase RhlE
MNFNTFNFDEKIMTGIKALGYSVPTPIQQQGMPPILEGRDVMGTAQTGTGKTAAFVLPILQGMLNRARGNVRALIIAPTRELTEQTNQVVQDLGRHTQHRGMSIYGGVSIQPQIQKLRRGVDIVSACPGRLLDHVERGTINLATVEVLVLDEADQMFDMGFLPDIRKIIKLLPKDRQTLLFSATMPREIQTLARDILRDPVTIQIGHAAPASTVTQAFYAVESEGKTTLLKNILSDTAASSVLVFTRTKHRAKSLAQQLEKTGYEATSLHGNLSQLKRQQALDGFRKGAYRVLVATDIAARGIDVADISHVVNYDMPDTADAYTHRVGRTGRAEKTGQSCSFVTRDDKDLIRCLERSLGAKLQLQKTETTAAVAYAHLQPPSSRRPQQQPARRASRPSEQKPAYRAQRQEHAQRPQRKDSSLPRERTEGKQKRGFMNSARRAFGFAANAR